MDALTSRMLAAACGCCTTVSLKIPTHGAGGVEQHAGARDIAPAATSRRSATGPSRRPHRARGGVRMDGTALGGHSTALSTTRRECRLAIGIFEAIAHSALERRSSRRHATDEVRVAGKPCDRREGDSR